MTERSTPPSPSHQDVIIVGAGLSGIGAAYALQKHAPRKRYLILEGRERSGGTWDLFRYPGVRSDTDMFTLGYAHRPWTRPETMAAGADILQYVRDAAREYGIEPHIRYAQRVVRASWSSADARWTLEVHDGTTGRPVVFTCDFLYLCSGYYDYAEGFQPDFPGRDRFAGQVVHPQAWPEGLDYAGKQVVVVGSGATAVTLVPSMSRQAAHVTMLQRSPTYIATLPGTDAFATTVRRWLPRMLAHRVARGKSIVMGALFYRLCRRRPEFAKKLLREGVKRQLPTGFDVDAHFKPRYEPWDERVCFVRDGDLFTSIRKGKASVVTDRIAHFTEDGLALESGRTLKADIVVTATGLKLKACGGIALEVDGRHVDIGKTFAWRGLMLSGVPNLAFCTGYTNASWTLRADHVSRFVARLVTTMDRRRARIVVPTCDEHAMQAEPLIGLRSGYVQRGAALFPKQGTEAPWRMAQSWWRDLFDLRLRPLRDPHLTFARDAGWADTHTSEAR